MSKISGLLMTLAVDDAAGDVKTLDNDANSLSLKTSRGEVDVTGLDKVAIERLALLTDAELTIGGTFNKDNSHAAFKSLDIFAGEVGRTVTIGWPDGVGLEMEMVPTDYSLDRGSDGSLTFSATLRLANGTKPTFSG